MTYDPNKVTVKVGDGELTLTVPKAIRYHHSWSFARSNRNSDGTVNERQFGDYIHFSVTVSETGYAEKIMGEIMLALVERRLTDYDVVSLDLSSALLKKKGT